VVDKLMTQEQAHHSRALDGFAILALALTFSLRYAPFLVSRLLFGPFLDNVHIYGPIFSEVSRLALSGAVPYYLPDIGTGFPVFESPHFSILYPFYFFGLVNYGGPLASLYTLTHLTLFHLFVFYLNLYVLLRSAAIPPWASYIGASVGLLARNTELYASWITVTASYAWLPLALAGAVLLLRFPGKACGILVVSIAAGLLALASASQSAIHAALSCLMLLAAGIAWLCLQRRFADIWRVACSVVACVGIAFGLAGAAIVPMYIASGEMIRHIGNGTAVIGHAHIPWENFNLNQLTLDQAMGIVVRPTWIHIVGSPYVGPLGVIGTLLAGIYFSRLDSFLRMLAVVFGVICLYGLLSGFGTNLGFAYLNFHLPLINRIREAGRHLVLFVIGLSFLSGLGYSLFGQSFKRYKQGHNGRLPILPAILLIAFAGIILWELFHYDYRQLPARFLIVGLAPILFALGHVCRLPRYNNALSAAVLVSAAGMVVPIWGIPASRSDFNKPMNLLSHRVIQDFAGKIDANNYRVDFLDANLPGRFWGMNASYYGIKSFYNLIPPQPYAQFRFSLMANVPHLREMMGARYVLCGPSFSPTDAGAKQILETEGYRLYENPGPMGRLTLVHRIAGFADNEGEFIKIITKGFDYFSEAYVTRRDFKGARQSLSNEQISEDSKDQITNVTNQANRSSSTVESSSASLLILNEWFTPAWKARVNGKTQPVLRVNQWQTGVLLGAGKNRVEFEYRPTLFRVLMILHRITAVLLLVFVIFVVVRRQRRITARGSSGTLLA
jgi:Bacterial membrane protein YfhO